MKRREALALIAAGASTVISRALAKGDIPPGVNQLDGTVYVNGAQAHVGTPVRPGDRVTTSHASSAVIVVGKDAFLLRSQTSIQFGKGSDGLLHEMLVATGGVLSVFSKKAVTIKAASASIGIRGTGAYLEIDPGGVYFCLCYGEAVVDGPGMASGRVVRTKHHEEPLLLHEDGNAMRIEEGPFRNHTDAELIMLEALVGREPPFMNDGPYPAGKY
ncbi:MAG TPA: hypothetical protein VH040_08685 [Usitatibacter sp.]|jgi:hypothetical protein|nr:hypothetical protein [Usitatibacter sp.]